MSFENMISYVVDFFNTHTIFAIAIVIIIVVFLFWRPKAVFKFAVFILIIGAAVWVIGLLGGSFTTGVKHKDDLIHKTDQDLKTDQGLKTDQNLKTDQSSKTGQRLEPVGIGGSFADRVKEKTGRINKTD